MLTITMVLLIFIFVSVQPVLGFLITESCGDSVDCKLDSLIQITARQQHVLDQQSQKIAALENQLSAMTCSPKNAVSDHVQEETTSKESEMPTMDACKSSGLKLGKFLKKISKCCRMHLQYIHLNTVLLNYFFLVGPETTIPSFYAIKSRDQRDLAKGGRIIFETAVTNVYKAYDVFSGVFKVPLKGTYGFMWNIAMNNIENHACFSLFVNDQVVGQTYLWNNGSDAMSTGFSIVEVNSGDDVFMSVCNVTQPLGEITSDIYRRTSFAGWCIACAG